MSQIRRRCGRHVLLLFQPDLGVCWVALAGLSATGIRTLSANQRSVVRLSKGQSACGLLARHVGVCPGAVPIHSSRLSDYDRPACALWLILLYNCIIRRQWRRINASANCSDDQERPEGRSMVGIVNRFPCRSERVRFAIRVVCQRRGLGCAGRGRC